MKKNVGILGGGVSGALLAYLLSREGHDVTLYDIQPKYVKPCGDVVPNIYNPPFPWEVRFRIKRFMFLLDGDPVSEVSYSRTKWIIIDKWNWINSMRKHVTVKRPEDLTRHEIVVDAKGPYNMDREVVYTTRALIKVNDFDDVAVFEFDSKMTGFYWIFPSSEGEYNVGAGFLEHRNSRELLLQYIKSRFAEFKLLDLRGAPISIGSPRSKSFRIGESRGLVYPLSGEGIRPSAISAEVAYEAISKGKDFEDFLSTDKRLKRIEAQIAIQRMLLSMYRLSSYSTRRSLLLKLMRSDVLIDAYLEDKIDPYGLVESLRALGNGVSFREL